jgi:hypothetical protein
VPNIVEDQARQRLQRAKAFLEKAHALMLQDDLVYRSALDDAVSAIKNDLQGFLLLKVASMQPPSASSPGSSGALRHEWQEVAHGNRMPDLLRSCMEAGLDLRGLDREIRKLNDERNSRTHDDPLRRVDTTQARQAVDLALLLHRRIQDAIRASLPGGARMPVPSVALSAAAAAPVLERVGIARGTVIPARASNGASAVGASSASSTSTQVRPAAVARKGGDLDPDGVQVADDTEDAQESAERAAIADAVRRRWMQRFVVRGGSIAALLALGTVAGVLLTLAVGGRLGARVPIFGGVGAASTATPGSLPANAFLAAGPLLVGAPVCQAGHTTLALRNTGTTPLQFSAGSPDNPGATFAIGAETPATQSAFGSVAPGATSALTVTTSSGGPARYHVVVTALGGSIELMARTC